MMEHKLIDCGSIKPKVKTINMRLKSECYYIGGNVAVNNAVSSHHTQIRATPINPLVSLRLLRYNLLLFAISACSNRRFL